MEVQPNEMLDGLYFLNANLTPVQLANNLNEKLSKAKALAVVAAAIDFDVYTADTLSTYFRTLAGIVDEAQWLHEELTKGREIA